MWIVQTKMFTFKAQNCSHMYVYILALGSYPKLKNIEGGGGVNVLRGSKDLSLGFLSIAFIFKTSWLYTTR